jgi:hypothetical protein
MAGLARSTQHEVAIEMAGVALIAAHSRMAAATTRGN